VVARAMKALEGAIDDIRGGARPLDAAAAHPLEPLRNYARERTRARVWPVFFFEIFFFGGFCAAVFSEDVFLAGAFLDETFFFAEVLRVVSYCSM
jgi:hypothetical protein